MRGKWVDGFHEIEPDKINSSIWEVLNNPEKIYVNIWKSIGNDRIDSKNNKRNK